MFRASRVPYDARASVRRYLPAAQVLKLRSSRAAERRQKRAQSSLPPLRGSNSLFLRCQPWADAQGYSLALLRSSKNATSKLARRARLLKQNDSHAAGLTEHVWFGLAVWDGGR